MKNAVYDMCAGTFAPMLGTLSQLLDKAAPQAAKIDLADAKLAPDMFPLMLQVQLACHHARDAVARLTKQEPPALPKETETLDQLKARIARTIEHLNAIEADAFDGAKKRKIEFQLQGPAWFEGTGLEFLRDWSLPHFYFHVVTAYDILRNQGVGLGKRDYMSHIGGHIRQRG
ncbi:MAG: DUF1993 domain-containing protein [Rhizomicrobium sp.]